MICYILDQCTMLAVYNLHNDLEGMENRMYKSRVMAKVGLTLTVFLIGPIFLISLTMIYFTHLTGPCHAEMSPQALA